jgi:hypothetical protein
MIPPAKKYLIIVLTIVHKEVNLTHWNEKTPPMPQVISIVVGQKKT